MSCRGSSAALLGFTSVLGFCLVFPCLAKEPRSARDYFDRGLTRAHAGDSVGAIEDFTSAIALNSNTHAPASAKYLRADVENEGQPRPDEKFLIVDKFNALAYFNRGNLLADQGRLREAIGDFDKAITLNPQLSRAFNNRGYVKYLTGDMDGATKDYDRSVQLDPQNPDTYYNRAVFRHKILNFAGAIADFNRTIEINPRIAVAFHDRGIAYLALASLDKAYSDFSRTIEMDPSLFTAYRNRGLVLILQGKETEAETDFARYLQCAGDRKETLEKLVQMARELRRANAAKASEKKPEVAP